MQYFIISASISSFILGFFGVSWDDVDRKIEEEFPAVEFISVDALQSQFLTRPQQLPLIIDVREAGEFAVSHLTDAINLESGAEISNLVSDKNRPIVVYCSVGYRSAAVAAELEALGYSSVRNLRHSLFEWADKGLPMENLQGQTKLVHPYNRVWGSLVSTELHSYSPQ